MLENGYKLSLKFLGREASLTREFARSIKDEDTATTTTSENCLINTIFRELINTLEDQEAENGYPSEEDQLAALKKRLICCTDFNEPGRDVKYFDKRKEQEVMTSSYNSPNQKK